MSRAAPWRGRTLAQAGMEARLTAAGARTSRADRHPGRRAAVLRVRRSRPGAAGQARIDVLLPGTLALAVIAAGLVNLGIATAYERAYGVIKRLGGSRSGGAAWSRPSSRRCSSSRSSGRPRARRRRRRRLRLAPVSGHLVAGRRGHAPDRHRRVRGHRARARGHPAGRGDARRSPTRCSSPACCSAGSSSRWITSGSRSPR